MAWLDITSPALRNYMNTWCQYRGGRKVPLASSFTEFASPLDPDFLAAISVTKNRECVFLSVGKMVGELLPGSSPGKPLSEVQPLPARLQLSRPIQEAIAAREPRSRRSSYSRPGHDSYFEHIILPFIDNDFDVRRLVIIADGYVVQKVAS